MTSKLRLAFAVAVAVSLTGAAVLLPASATVTPAVATGYAPQAGFTADFGAKHSVGYFLSENGGCAVTVMIADRTDPDVALPGEAARVRFAVAAGTSATVETGSGAGLALGCSADASRLTVNGFGDA